MSATAAALAMPAAGARGEAAPGQRAGAEGVPAKVLRVAGSRTEATASGLYRVRPARGPALLTHGPDQAAIGEAARRNPSALAARSGFAPGDAERAPICTADHHLHVVYAHPASRASRYGEIAPRIRAAVRRMNAVLYSDAVASGGPGADYRVRCNGGDIDVASVTTQGSTFEAIVSAVRGAGLASAVADYLIFFDGQPTSSCGIATYEIDERLTAANESNDGGGYAVAYSSCWSTGSPMHEAAHMMGAVQPGAPNSTGDGGHCVDEHDVVCYSPDGGNLNQGGTVTRCSGAERFDCNFDDYFDTRTEGLEYLATHWNLGSPLNRFLVFGGAPTSTGLDLGALISGLLGGGQSKGARLGEAGAPGEWRLYRITVPKGARSLRVALSGSPAGLELYVRRGKAPKAKHQYACRRGPTGDGASCMIKRPRKGRWIAGVRNASAAPGAEFRIVAEVKRRRGKRR